MTIEPVPTISHLHSMYELLDRLPSEQLHAVVRDIEGVLPPEQRRQAVETRPSWLPYVSCHISKHYQN